MIQGRNLGFVIVLAVVAVAGGCILTAQWQQTLALRVELESARVAEDELQRLRAENLRLREQQIAATELERLRADHAALPRLRAEFEALNKR